MTSQTTTKNPDPSVLASNGATEVKKSLWVLHYRKGNNPHPMTKNFWHEGSLREVVERAKKHCETVGERFVRLEPFVTDLALTERQHLGLREENAD